VSAPAFFHVGILVDDLDGAIARFSELLPLTFGRPRTLAIDEWDPVTEAMRARELRFIYSDEGPPFIELMEAQDDGVWGLQQGEGLHHIGFWQPGFDEGLAALPGLGHAIETLMPRLSEATAAYVAPAHLHGTRVELVCPFDQRPKPAGGRSA
jgi:hypothetical protein